MNYFLGLPLLSQIIILLIGMPLGLFLFYIIFRLIFTAFFESMAEYRARLIKKIMTGIPGKHQENIKNQGGPKDVC